MKRPRYRLMPSKDGQWYFVLDAANGEPIATSETYPTKQAAKNGIRSVRVSAPFATVEEQATPAPVAPTPADTTGTPPS